MTLVDAGVQSVNLQYLERVSNPNAMYNYSTAIKTAIHIMVRNANNHIHDYANNILV